MILLLTDKDVHPEFNGGFKGYVTTAMYGADLVLRINADSKGKWVKAKPIKDRHCIVPGDEYRPIGTVLEEYLGHEMKCPTLLSWKDVFDGDKIQRDSANCSKERRLNVMRMRAHACGYCYFALDGKVYAVNPEEPLEKVPKCLGKVSEILGECR